MSEVAVPVLRTERLRLRGPRAEDFESYAAILASDRAVHMGGPFTPDDAWCDFCQMVACWILRGYGPWTVEPLGGGDFLGLAILHHERGDPEPELGWVMTDAGEGHGFAVEAAGAARAYAFEILGWRTVVSYVAPANVRSIRLAERLGAANDPKASRPDGDAECLVYRHWAAS